jgi:hypothetical protein
VMLVVEGSWGGRRMKKGEARWSWREPSNFEIPSRQRQRHHALAKVRHSYPQMLSTLYESREGKFILLVQLLHISFYSIHSTSTRLCSSLVAGRPHDSPNAVPSRQIPFGESSTITRYQARQARMHSFDMATIETQIRPGGRFLSPTITFF